MTWTPAVTVSDWGRLQLVTGGTDVTNFRGVPAVIESYGSTEPFGDEAMVVRFPQISPFEHVSSSPIDWLEKGQNIELKLVRPNGSVVVLWSGQILSTEGRTDESESALALHCRGAILTLDNGLKQPSFDYRERDIGYVIAEAFNRYSGRSHGKCQPVLTGITTRQRGAWTPVATGFVQDLLGTAALSDGSNQWTVKQQHRTPVIALKDRTTIHATLTTGTPGLTIELASDLTGAPNVIYGEGISPDGQRWRNTKYPNFHPDTTPAFPLSVGAVFSPGGGSTGFRAFADELRDNGYSTVVSGDTYAAADQAEVRDAQKRAGITIDGLVGAQTWNAIFQTGSNVGDLNAAYCAPLAFNPAVEPYLYNARGGKIGTNPAYDPSVPRIERYENFGEGITKQQAVTSARAELAHVSEAGHQGTLTLRVDPEEISRFELRAGMNISLKSWQGIDRVLHVANAQAVMETMTVTLAVDTHARDAITLAAIRSRNSDAATDPVRRTAPPRRRSRQTADNVMIWDAESGAGIIPKHNLTGGLWTVIRIPAGQVGNIVRSDFNTVSPAAPFALGVFIAPVTPADLVRYVGNPLTTENAWDVHADALYDLGLVQAWGDKGDRCGFYPRREGDTGATVTGRMIDDQGWQYESQRPPWLWLAEFSSSSCQINGRLYAGVDF